MVVITKPSALDQLPISKLHRPAIAYFAAPIPIIDLGSPTAPAQLVSACEEFGFFKLTNHGVSPQITTNFEAEAVKFFSLPLWKKGTTRTGTPFGYGSREIGCQGDVGWIEYLLLQTNSINTSLSSSLRSAVNEYTSAIKKLACDLLELLADGLGLRPRNTLSKLLMHEESDLMLRLNHYPPCLASEDLNAGITGFGEHTDPQLISILRSNNTSGLQILPRGGRWVPVPPDPSSFFVNVGDTLQVLTNGRFKSIKHRVLANTLKSRLSMIFFGGPPLKELVAPLRPLIEDGEESLYREFTWHEYKAAAFKSKLVDDRLIFFEKR